MATSAPPDGWNFRTGVWGTDGTQLTTGGVGTGGINLQAVSASSVTLVSDWISIDTSGASNQLYAAQARFSVASTAARVEIDLVMYQTDKKTVLSTQTLWPSGTAFTSTGPQTASLTVFASTLTAYARWEVTVTTTNPVVFFGVSLERVSPNLIASATSAQSIAGSTSTWVPVQFAATVSQNIYLLTNKTDIGINKAGLYKFHANITLANTAWTAGTTVQARLVQITSGSTSVVGGPFTHRINATAETHTLSFSQAAWLSVATSAGSTTYNTVFEIQILQSYTATAATTVVGATTLNVTM